MRISNLRKNSANFSLLLDLAAILWIGVLTHGESSAKFPEILQRGGQTPPLFLFSTFVPKVREIKSKIADFFAGGLREYRDQASSIVIASRARGDGGLP
jgi:hypothetical protein